MVVVGTTSEQLPKQKWNRRPKTDALVVMGVGGQLFCRRGENIRAGGPVLLRFGLPVVVQVRVGRLPGVRVGAGCEP